MSHAPFSPGDKVEYAGDRIGEVYKGPERRAGHPWYLVQCLNTYDSLGDSTLSDWQPEHALQLADDREWVYSQESNTYSRRVPVRHMGPRLHDSDLIPACRPMLCCGKTAGSLPRRDIVVGDPFKVSCASRPLAVRYWCLMRNYPGSGLQHTSGNGSPSRRFCKNCHGELAIEHGLWGVFRWRGDGRYPWQDALYTYTRLDVADKRATSPEAKADQPEQGGWVTRWIPLGS